MYPIALALFLIWLIIQMRSLVLILAGRRTSVHRKEKFTKKELEQVHNYLDKHSYYHLLSVCGKALFLNRVMRFVVNKQFVGMEGLEITDEMRVRIAACAIQITWGLDNYLLRQFKLFRIYPKEFYIRLIEKVSQRRNHTIGSGYVLLEQF